MVLIAVTCPYGQSDHIAKRGKTDSSQQRYRCQNPNCPYPCFLLVLAYKGRLPQIKEQAIDIALNGSGIRDAARVLGISTGTVINELKKESSLIQSISPCSQDDLLLQVHSAARYDHRFVCQSV